MEVVSEGGTLLTVCENGFGKRTDVTEYRRQTRGGIGLKNVQTSERNGQVVGVACVSDGDQLLLVTEQGQIIRMTAGDLRPMGRDTQGVRVMDLADGDRLVSLATLREPDDAETTAAAESAAPEPAPLAPAPAETEPADATAETDVESDEPDGGESE
jgi:DNA gyrase subunit A